MMYSRYSSFTHLLSKMEDVPDHLFHQSKWQRNLRLLQRHKLHNSNVNIGWRHETRAGDSELMLHIAQVLAHDRESTPLPVQYGSHHSLSDLLLKGQGQFYPTVFPCTSPLGHRLEPIYDEWSWHVEWQVADDVYFGRTVIPCLNRFCREQVVHVKSQDVTIEDAHLTARHVVQKLQNHQQIDLPKTQSRSRWVFIMVNMFFFL